MRIVVFLDLDDSLFQTRLKCPPGEALSPATLDATGQPSSFMTARQQHLLGWLRAGTIIPTTARNLTAYRNVTLTFDSLVILDFGGVVLLPDGQLDRDWDARVRPQCVAVAAELEHLCTTMQKFSADHHLGVRVRVIHDFAMPLYVVAKHPAGDVGTLERLRHEALLQLDADRFFVHANDNNLSVVPRFLGKEHAVRYICDRHLGDEPMLTVGVGDSLTDAGFLSACDFALVPRGSQLMRLLRE